MNTMKTTTCAAGLMLLTACSGAREATSERLELRRDTLHATLAEHLSVRLDDVVIIPPDSSRPILTARKAELRRLTETEITRGEQETAHIEEHEKTEAPVKAPPLWWPLLLITAVVVILRLWCR